MCLYLLMLERDRSLFYLHDTLVEHYIKLFLISSQHDALQRTYEFLDFFSFF